MARKREPLAVRMDARRATVDAATVARLEDEVASLREQLVTSRSAWRAVSQERDQLRGKALVYKRAARRRYMVMLRLAEWSRRGHDQAKAARALVMRYRERWNEALLDGERFRQERDSVQGVLDALRRSHTRDNAALTRERDQALSRMTEAIIDRDLVRREVSAATARGDQWKSDALAAEEALREGRNDARNG